MDNDVRFYESQLEIRSENGQTILEGLASPTYDGTAKTEYRLGENQIERFAKGAFDEFLRSEPEIEIRVNHDPAKVVAVTPTSAKVWADSKGLHYRAEVDTEISYNKDLVRQVSKKIMRGSSIRFGPLDSQWSKEGKDEVRTVTRAYVVECSPVYKPAYHGTSAYMRDLETWRQVELTREKEKRLAAIDISIVPSGVR